MSALSYEISRISRQIKNAVEAGSDSIVGDQTAQHTDEQGRIYQYTTVALHTSDVDPVKGAERIRDAVLERINPEAAAEGVIWRLLPAFSIDECYESGGKLIGFRMRAATRGQGKLFKGDAVVKDEGVQVAFQ